jgi:hypothetical protein
MSNKWLERAIIAVLVATMLFMLFALVRAEATPLAGGGGCKRVVTDCAITADGKGLADGTCTTGYFLDAKVARQRVFSKDWLYTVKACEDGKDLFRDVKIGLRSFRVE